MQTFGGRSRTVLEALLADVGLARFYDCDAVVL
jgi:hypothetical protein